MKAASVSVKSFQTADGWQLNLLIGLGLLLLTLVAWIGMRRAERWMNAHA